MVVAMLVTTLSTLVVAPLFGMRFFFFNICAFPVNLEGFVTFSDDSIPLSETQSKSIFIGLHIAFL